MALADPVVVTYNAVAKNLVRINQDAYGSEYYLEDGTERFTLKVQHTVPPKGGANESHMVRLDVEHYDAEGALLRVSSAWTVIKTFDGKQDSTSSDRVTQALVDLLSDAFILKVIGRES